MTFLHTLLFALLFLGLKNAGRFRDVPQLLSNMLGLVNAEIGEWFKSFKPFGTVEAP
jgi:hypothetical protein